MYPILGRYGRFFLYSYTVVIGLGIIAAIGLTAWRARRLAQTGDSWLGNWFDGLLVILAAGLIGGRAGFVWAEWEYFQQRPAEAWQIWQGGLSYHGALAAGLLALWGWWAYCRRQQTPFAAYAGLFAPALALGSAFGWLACWLEGCAYGRETTLGLWSADLPDTFGVYAVRYQTQLLGAGLALVVFFAVVALWCNRQPQRLFWFTLLGLSFGRVIVTLYRGDDVASVSTIRLDTFLDGALALISLMLLQYQR
ncbi:MAG TPA: prolipoprotein diacylglyceryl transferase family protein [Anaerolineae bacterium]